MTDDQPLNPPSFDDVYKNRDNLEIWGVPAESLPSRPFSIMTLLDMANGPHFDEIHVPPEGQKLHPDVPGPCLTAEARDFLSEFVATRNGDVYLFRYGWPEVVRGRLKIPRDLQLAKKFGYIRWWFSLIDVEGLPEGLDPRSQYVPISERVEGNRHT